APTKKDTRQAAPAAKKPEAQPAKGGGVSKFFRALVGCKPEAAPEKKPAAEAAPAKPAEKKPAKVEAKAKDHGKSAPIAPAQKAEPKAPAKTASAKPAPAAKAAPASGKGAKPAPASKAIPADDPRRTQMGVEAIRRAAEAVGAA